MAERDLDAPRVLLVEDHPVGQRVATVMLESLGFQVDVAADGAAAVQAATIAPYDFILMDCQIPVIDGYEATVAIRHLQGPTRHTRIIALTAAGETSDIERCLAAGMDDHLAKPLSLQTLTAVIARATGGSNDGTQPEPVSPAGARGDEADASRAVLNPVIVDRLGRVGRIAGQDLMGQLTVLFLDDAAAGVDAMRAALADDDTATVTRCAHTLGGASANLGAAHLSKLCAALETAGATADRADRGRLLAAVDVELGRVRSALGALASSR